MFAHGSGSSRFSTRNQKVAAFLAEAGLATLLFDLLTKEEEATDIKTAEYRFNIPLLGERLTLVTDWILKRSQTKDYGVGYFGASTGAAAALIAAANRPMAVKAVVSRGGRPDLAATHLERVKAPTLLIVGGLDYEVIKLNQQAMGHLKYEAQLEVVPGATHLFEEPGTLDQVCELACQWLISKLNA